MKKTFWDYMKAGWSRKIIIGLYLWHVVVLIFIGTNKIASDGFLQFTEIIFGVLAVGTIADKGIEIFKVMKSGKIFDDTKDGANVADKA